MILTNEDLDALRQLIREEVRRERSGEEDEPYEPTVDPVLGHKFFEAASQTERGPGYHNLLRALMANEEIAFVKMALYPNPFMDNSYSPVGELVADGYPSGGVPVFGAGFGGNGDVLTLRWGCATWMAGGPVSIRTAILYDTRDGAVILRYTRNYRIWVDRGSSFSLSAGVEP